VVVVLDVVVLDVVVLDVVVLDVVRLGVLVSELRVGDAPMGPVVEDGDPLLLLEGAAESSPSGCPQAPRTSTRALNGPTNRHDGGRGRTRPQVPGVNGVRGGLGDRDTAVRSPATGRSLRRRSATDARAAGVILVMVTSSDVVDESSPTPYLDGRSTHVPLPNRHPVVIPRHVLFSSGSVHGPASDFSSGVDGNMP
jgi:hypothetical protein